MDRLGMRLVDRPVDFIEESIDVSIWVGDLTDSSLCATKIGDARIATCASPYYLQRRGRPSRPQDLPDHDAVIFTRINEVPWLYYRDGQKFQGLPRIRLRVNSPACAVAAAARGLGLARALDVLVEGEMRSGELVHVLDDYDGGSLPVHLVYVRKGLIPAKVRAFLDWMTPRLRQRLKGVTTGASAAQY